MYLLVYYQVNLLCTNKDYYNMFQIKFSQYQAVKIVYTKIDLFQHVLH